MKLALEKIIIDESIYPRSGVDETNVGRIESAIKIGTKLPPLIVEAKTHRLVDGRHRYAAYVKQEVKTVEVTEKVYATEADLFADAVRFNASHGEPLDSFSIKNSIIRLEEYGYSRDKISEVVRLPVEQIEKITRGFARDAETGKPIALKGALSHMAQQPLNKNQQDVNRHFGGPKATFYVRQLCDVLANDMWPRTENFAVEMDRLVDLWIRVKRDEAA